MATAAFFRAHTTGQTDDCNEFFTGDARVSDEAHECRGTAIKEWIDEAIAKYKPVADVIDLVEAGAQTIATAQVSGNFPVSPAQLRYHFTLQNGKIDAISSNHRVRSRMPEGLAEPAGRGNVEPIGRALHGVCLFFRASTARLGAARVRSHTLDLPGPGPTRPEAAEEDGGGRLAV